MMVLEMFELNVVFEAGMAVYRAFRGVLYRAGRNHFAEVIVILGHVVPVPPSVLDSIRAS